MQIHCGIKTILHYTKQSWDGGNLRKGDNLLKSCVLYLENKSDLHTNYSDNLMQYQQQSHMLDIRLSKTKHNVNPLLCQEHLKM